MSAALTSRAYQANNTAQTVISDGSYADTARAVAYAIGQAQNGWVVTVGAAGGTYTWTNGLVIGLANSITIQGADPINRPTIIFTGTIRSGIYISANNNFALLKDLIFNVTPTGPAANVVDFDGSGVCFRVSNCEFLNSSTGIGTGTAFGLQIGGINSLHQAGPYGLVDHCQFYFPGGIVYNYINVFANGNIDGWCWTQPMSWGTTNSVVVESCDFSQPHASPMSGLVEAMGGARLTLRYNNITNIPESTHGIQSGARSSTLQIECYENNWMLNDTTFTMSYVYLQRGGTSVIWSNNVTSTSFWNLGGACQFWVECAATSLWQAEGCTSELFYPANYPGPEQIGQGVVNGAAGLVPVYIWGNNFPNTTWGVGLGRDTGDAPFIQQGRDIFTNSVMPNYTPLVFPHPLVTSSGGTGTNVVTPISGGVIPPSNLQAHPPAGP
ncbi:MAG: hypothetical protein ABSH48_00440 [Verrucomicrobiota bacterium]